MIRSEYEAELHVQRCKSIFDTLAIRRIPAVDDMHILLRADAENTTRKTGGGEYGRKKKLQQLRFRPEPFPPCLPRFVPAAQRIDSWSCRKTS